MPRPGFDRVTLLTGFPSFFPRQLARHILERDPRSLLYAVVRSKFAGEAEDVLKTFPASLRSRLIVLEGDAAAMDLGLSAPELRMLARETDYIHQAAHVSYAGVDRREAEHVNVAAAQEIVEVARLCTHLRCLVFHSTVEVAGDRSGVVLERELEAGQRFASVVAETRALAEKIVRGAMCELPIAIVRAGTVVGDSTTGAIDRFDGPYGLILQIVSSTRDAVLPPPWRADAPLNLVPVDFVVRASYAIGSDPRAPGRTFHLVDPHPRTARAVLELVAKASGRPSPREYLPPQVARAMLRNPSVERLLAAPRALVERLLQPPVFDSTNTEELLSGTDIACPRIEDYVEQLVRYVEDKLRDRRSGSDGLGDESRPRPPLVRETE